MNVSDILKRECVRYPLQSSDKTEVVVELVDLLDSQGLLTDRQKVLDAVLARERTRSTGVGLGLAVPHGKSHGCETLTMAVGKTEEPMAFDAVDGRPCSFIVLLSSPFDKTGPHIQALASISRLWQNESFRTEVLHAQTADEIYAAFEKFPH